MSRGTGDPTEPGEVEGPGRAAGPGEPAIIVVPDPFALSATAAERIADLLAVAVAARGRADIALTGGSSSRDVYRHLVEPALADRVPWTVVHLWWGDDRFVRRTDRLSNVLAADQVLLGPRGIAIPTANVHPFPIDRAIDERLGPEWCAATYGAEVAAALPAGLPAAPDRRWPAFDIVLVGLGDDGHLFSVFPGSVALTSDRLSLAIPAPSHIEPHVERVTLNPAILASAGQVLAIVAGSSKADVIARILEGPRDRAALPGILARRANAIWLLDAAAAGALTARPGSA